MIVASRLIIGVAGRIRRVLRVFFRCLVITGGDVLGLLFAIFGCGFLTICGILKIGGIGGSQHTRITRGVGGIFGCFTSFRRSCVITFGNVCVGLLLSGPGGFGIGGLLLLIAVMRTMRETLPPEKVIPLRISTIARNYWGLLGHKKFICYTLAGGFGSAGMFAYIAGSPRVFIEIFHVDPAYFGFLFGLNAAALVIASQISARLLNRHAPQALLKIAQITLACATLSALLITLMGGMTLFILMLCLMGFMASQGFVSPNAAALALAEQGGRLGVASALMGTLQMLCGAVAGLGVSEWQSTTPLPLTCVLALCACLSWLFGRIALRSSSPT